MFQTHEDGPDRHPRTYQAALVVGVDKHDARRLKGAVADAHRWAGALAPLRPTVLENPTNAEFGRAFQRFINAVDPTSGAGVFVFCGPVGQYGSKQALCLAGDEHVEYDELVVMLDQRFREKFDRGLPFDGKDTRGPRCRFLAVVDGAPAKGKRITGVTWRTCTPRVAVAPAVEDSDSGADFRPRFGGHARHYTPPQGIAAAERWRDGWGWGGDLTFHALANPGVRDLSLPLFAHEIFGGTNGVAIPYRIRELSAPTVDKIVFCTWQGYSGAVPAKCIASEVGWPNQVMTLEPLSPGTPSNAPNWPRWENSPFVLKDPTWGPPGAATISQSYIVQRVTIATGAATEIGRMAVYQVPGKPNHLWWWTDPNEVDAHGFYAIGPGEWLRFTPGALPGSAPYVGYQTRGAPLP